MFNNFNDEDFGDNPYDEFDEDEYEEQLKRAQKMGKQRLSWHDESYSMYGPVYNPYDLDPSYDEIDDEEIMRDNPEIFGKDHDYDENEFNFLHSGMDPEEAGDLAEQYFIDKQMLDMPQVPFKPPQPKDKEDEIDEDEVTIVIDSEKEAQKLREMKLPPQPQVIDDEMTTPGGPNTPGGTPGQIVKTREIRTLDGTGVYPEDVFSDLEDEEAMIMSLLNPKTAERIYLKMLPTDKSNLSKLEKNDNVIGTHFDQESEQAVYFVVPTYQELQRSYSDHNLTPEQHNHAAALAYAAKDTPGGIDVIEQQKQILAEIQRQNEEKGWKPPNIDM